MISANKQRLRRAFNTATETYDKAADWQKDVADILLLYLNAYSPEQKTILDLGSGTGYLTRNIQANHPNNRLIALDIAEAMLHFSKQSIPQCELICTDAENPSLNNACIDMTISNMVLQWCDSLNKTIQAQYRILKPGGLFLFSILGDDSLSTLKTAWGKIDDYAHVNTFPKRQDILQACLSAHFSIVTFEQHDITKHYNTVFELMQHLKATGANTVTHQKPKGLTGKNRIQQLNKHYHNPTCYEVFAVVCQK